jgi:hypothetical protein
MSFRGHPWLGAISGLFLGLGVAILLQQFSIRPLDNLSFFGLPLLGIVLGLLVAAWAPFRRGGVSVSAGPATMAGPATVPAAPTVPTQSEPPPPPPSEPPTG